MDILIILSNAIEALPQGDHTIGIRSVLRHVRVAVDHFAKASENSDPEGFTDAIYRANLAFEGSLKEAYRVLADKDPQKVKLFDIEQFMSNSRVLRPRVLQQFTRYRQDYRNPSAHDYSLDFDRDEAILAILSVGAFSKLLIDQISEKIAHDESYLMNNRQSTDAFKNMDWDIEKLSNTVISLSEEIGKTPLTESQFEGHLAGHLKNYGLNIDLNPKTEKSGFQWDLLLDTKIGRFPIEIKHFDYVNKLKWDLISPLMHEAKSGHYNGMFLVARKSGSFTYKAEVYKDSTNFIFIIVRPEGDGLGVGSEIF